MPETKTLMRPILNLHVVCPECEEDITVQVLENGKNEEAAVEHDWCSRKFLVPAILVKDKPLLSE